MSGDSGGVSGAAEPALGASIDSELDKLHRKDVSHQSLSVWPLNEYYFSALISIKRTPRDNICLVL